MVFKLIPCCLTLKPLVTSRLPTNLMLSRICSCCAQDESTVSASLGDHTRERDLPQQYPQLSPSSSLDTGKGRDATGGVGSGKSDAASARVPSPQPKSINIYWSCWWTVTHPKPGVAPTALHPAGAAVSSPHPPVPTHLALPTLVTAQAVPAMHLKALRQKL